MPLSLILLDTWGSYRESWFFLQWLSGPFFWMTTQFLWKSQYNLTQCLSSTLHIPTLQRSPFRELFNFSTEKIFFLLLYKFVKYYSWNFCLNLRISSQSNGEVGGVGSVEKGEIRKLLEKRSIYLCNLVDNIFMVIVVVKKGNSFAFDKLWRNDCASLTQMVSYSICSFT